VVLKKKGIKAKMEINHELKKEFQGTRHLINGRISGNKASDKWQNFKEQGI